MSSKILSISLVIWNIVALAVCAQDLKVHEKYGVEIDFPDGWYLAGESAYSSILQTQFYFDSDTLHWISLERYLALSQINKNNWHQGLPYGHPFDQADHVTEIDTADLLLNIPEMVHTPFQTSKTGVNIFLVESSDTAIYVVFLARGHSYVRLMIGTRESGLNLHSIEVRDLIQRIKILPGEPPLEEDPYTEAQRMYTFDKDYERALVLYKQVPKDHPKYADAQRAIGYGILGNQFGDWEAAVAYVEAAYKVSPDDPKVLEDIGRVYLKTDRQEQGIEYLEKAGTRVAHKILRKHGTN